MYQQIVVVGDRHVVEQRMLAEVITVVQRIHSPQLELLHRLHHDTFEYMSAHILSTFYRRSNHMTDNCQSDKHVSEQLGDHTVVYFCRVCGSAEVQLSSDVYKVQTQQSYHSDTPYLQSLCMGNKALHDMALYTCDFHLSIKRVHNYRVDFCFSIHATRHQL